MIKIVDMPRRTGKTVSATFTPPYSEGQKKEEIVV